MMPEALSCHRDFPTDAVSRIEVTVDYLPTGKFLLHYRVLGVIDQLILPEPLPPERSDDLWQQSCFEAFIGASDDPAYLELNFSPSTQWAAYAFSGYREGMSDLELVAPPHVECSISADSFDLRAELDLGGLAVMDATVLELALTAVVAEKNGRKSFWALSHASGNPDFHNRDCFLHTIETAESR